MTNVSQFLKQLPSKNNAEQFGIYPKSIFENNGLWVMMVGEKDQDYLISYGPGMEQFKGELINDYTKSTLNHHTASVLRELFPFTKATKVLDKERSIGLGDRLGLAQDGHIEVFEKYDAYPILAQQSIRELDMTGRTYLDVMDAATFGVFRNGFTRGFGADGDHLKTKKDIEYAIALGFTMITLDCSDYIDNNVLNLTDAEINAKVELSKEEKDLYVNHPVVIEGNEIDFDETELKRCKLIYDDAIDYTIEIYEKYIKFNDNVNFELSIDETATPTTPTQHYYVASKLYAMNVKLDTLAPRFIGQFQKGIDYIGDLKSFEADFIVHAAIARNFGYKLSIHSGSDKFSIFKIAGKHTKGRFHVKTAGTNWLEALEVIAIKDPSLYREIHKFAFSKFDDATKLYHVTTDLAKIPNIDDLNDEEILQLFANDDARQVIHITYGYILTLKDDQGNLVFKNRMYKLWRKELKEYAKHLVDHIGKHLQLLYEGFQQ